MGLRASAPSVSSTWGCNRRVGIAGSGEAAAAHACTEFRPEPWNPTRVLRCPGGHGQRSLGRPHRGSRHCDRLDARRPGRCETHRDAEDRQQARADREALESQADELVAAVLAVRVAGNEHDHLYGRWLAPPPAAAPGRVRRDVGRAGPSLCRWTPTVECGWMAACSVTVPARAVGMSPRSDSRMKRRSRGMFPPGGTRKVQVLAGQCLHVRNPGVQGRGRVRRRLPEDRLRPVSLLKHASERAGRSEDAPGGLPSRVLPPSRDGSAIARLFPFAPVRGGPDRLSGPPRTGVVVWWRAPDGWRVRPRRRDVPCPDAAEHRRRRIRGRAGSG